MNINDKAVETLSQTIVSAVNTATENINYDKTYDGSIIEIIGNNSYKVKFNGAVYTAPLYIKNMTLAIGDFVKITVPQNNWANIYISSVGNSGATGGGTGGSITTFNSDGSITINYGANQDVITFIDNTIITTTYANGQILKTNTITFNSDGSIKEEVK